MDAVEVAETDVITPRATLAAIVTQCDKALGERLARRFATRDMLNLRSRAQGLLEREDGREFNEDFEQLLTTANAVFDELVDQMGGMPEETAH